MPRVWMALFFGYNGTNFNGMQHQKEEHIATVQDLLISKLFQGGLLTTNIYSELQRKEKWSRAARTDKGVHAIINGISCLFLIQKSFYHEDGTLNKSHLHLHLSELFTGTEIVFHAIKKVTNRFEMRRQIKARQYSYLCPLSIFTQSKEEVENLLKNLNDYCKQFVGTHNFHNYSKNIKAKQPQAHRFIVSFDCEILGNFVKFKIVGQSFIYHQIRKMIGCIIKLSLSKDAPSFIPNTFFRNQIHIPLAPSHGLYLQTLHFDHYNRKLEIPEKLQLTSLETVAQLKHSIQQFIMAKDQMVWKQWINQLKEADVKIGQRQQEDSGMSD